MTSTSTSTAYFLKPTQLAEITNVWHMGEECELEWHCDFSFLTLRLWQHDYTSPQPRAGRIFFGITSLPKPPPSQLTFGPLESTSTPPTSKYSWTVDTYEHDKTFSNLYFIMVLNSTNVTVADGLFDVVSVEAFRTPNFIIEAAVSSSSTATATLTSATSTPSWSLPTASGTPPLESIEVAPKSSAVQVGVPVGVAAALIFVGVLGWFVWRRRRQRRGEGEGEVALPLGQDLKGPEMKTGMGGDKVGVAEMGVAEMGAEGNLFEAPAGDVKRLSELRSYSAPVELEG